MVLGIPTSGSTCFPTASQQYMTNDVVQIDKKAFEADAKARATANSSSRYGQQEVCQISGLIINSEETRVRDHKMGRNYRCAWLYKIVCSAAMHAVCVHPWLEDMNGWRNAVSARLTLHAIDVQAAMWHVLSPPVSCCRSWCKLHEQLTELNETVKKRTEQAALPPPPRLPSKDREGPRSSSNSDRHTLRDREREKRSEPDRRQSRDREKDRDRYALPHQLTIIEQHLLPCCFS